MEARMVGRQNVGLETDTDSMVDRWLSEIKVEYSAQATNIKEIDDALKAGASKSKDNPGKGYPDFIFQSKNYLFIIENKPNNKQLEKLDKKGQLLLEYPNNKNFAVNGAVYYAKHIIDRTTNYKEIIAIGITGNTHRFQIQPYYVTSEEVRRLDDLKSLEEFSSDNIEEYWRVAIKGDLPKEERDLIEINKVAAEIHEDLRNYGNLEGERKATVVSAILLALEEPTFSPDDLKGFQKEGAKDGDKIFNAIETYLRSLDFNGRYAKYGIMLDNFAFLKTDDTLNAINGNIVDPENPKNVLNMTPLKWLAQILDKKVVHLMKSDNDIDILGNFYGEFVKYGGSDGNPLGIVLTPRHITNLMAELIDIQPYDTVLDPACGSGAFLISAMQRMLKIVDNDKKLSEKAKNNKKKEIKKEHLYGIELNGKLYTIATTNMILRGDGKSNLEKGDMFHLQLDAFDANNGKITKVLMNPPYSQAKKTGIAHLSEISFIKRALEMMKPGGKLAAIVPLSTMTAPLDYEKEYKREILENHTLDTVITLNPETFYGTGTEPCICIFESGKPHNFNKKKVKFVDFRDDGYEVRKHLGLYGNGTEKSKRDHLIEVLNGDIEDNSKFIVKTKIEADDEWLHAFYYFNDENPQEEDFMKTIADYVTFEVNMRSHGNGYLFDESGDNIEDNE
ncbi:MULTISPECIES: HsdM family class I SAM-dependent methyltransferase [Bacillus cereus group]|uniref:HsdM family class I SAM-dependent methyltransferase n=1 Tax=Bacillus cereus group TaxID=86661 RepID=UPI001F31C9FE|nr:MULTISPECIES: N-6 DNA methylase [Bacillus cereus group]